MVGGLGAHVGARERWQRRVGGWYREGVQAIGGCGEGTLGENMGSKEWRGGGEVETLPPGVRRACGGLEGVRTLGMGWKFGTKSRRTGRFQDTSTKGVSVQRVTPGGVFWTG